FDEDCARVEQVEAAALHVLMRSRPRLGGDDGDVAPASHGVREAHGEQRAVNTSAALRRGGRPTAELCDAVGDAHAGAAWDDAVAQRDVAHVAGRGEVSLGTLEDVAGKVLVRGHALRVRGGATPSTTTSGQASNSSSMLSLTSIPGGVTRPGS